MVYPANNPIPQYQEFLQMPITQDRLITAINGMVELRQALTTAYGWLTAARAKTKSIDPALDYAIINMSQLMNETFSKYDPTILVELHYFRQNRQRNIRAKNKMAQRRREAGIQPRNYAKPTWETTDVLALRSLDTANKLDNAPAGETFTMSPEEEQAILDELKEIQEARANHSQPRSIFEVDADGNIVQSDEDC